MGGWEQAEALRQENEQLRAQLAELQADKDRWDALEALPHAIRVSVMVHEVKSDWLPPLRSQIDHFLAELAALKQTAQAVEGRPEGRVF